MVVTAVNQISSNRLLGMRTFLDLNANISFHMRIFPNICCNINNSLQQYCLEPDMALCIFCGKIKPSVPSVCMHKQQGHQPYITQSHKENYHIFLNPLYIPDISTCIFIGHGLCTPTYIIPISPRAIKTKRKLSNLISREIAPGS